MRLAISNIAWDPSEDEAIAALLRRFGLDAIDVAPSKYFPDPDQATSEDVLKVRDWWKQRQIDIIGMQSLLFGTQGLNVFAAQDVQQRMLNHLQQVCRIGSILGAKRLVFGSPKNRDRQNLSDEEAMAIAVPFFQRLGDIAKTFDVMICLEPNPACYNCNFMTTSAETAQVVMRVNHPSVRMQFDTGASTINKEDSGAFLREHAGLAGHIHASEPNLVPLGDGGTDHAAMARHLKTYLPQHPVSIEMLATTAESHEKSIARALQVATQNYAVQKPGKH